MIDALKAAFPQIDERDCLQVVTDNLFYIFDQEEHPKRCFIQTDPNGVKHFLVNNPTGKQISFLAIDKGLFKDGYESRRCDCAVFDNYIFCFIEIKTFRSVKKRSIKKQDAKEQLRTTILLFKGLNIFSSERLQAYACVGTTISRPARRATDLNEILEFEEELGVELYHGNEMEFD